MYIEAKFEKNIFAFESKIDIGIKYNRITLFRADPFQEIATLLFCVFVTSWVPLRKQL